MGVWHAEGRRCVGGEASEQTVRCGAFSSRIPPAHNCNAATTKQENRQEHFLDRSDLTVTPRGNYSSPDAAVSLPRRPQTCFEH